MRKWRVRVRAMIGWDGMGGHTRLLIAMRYGHWRSKVRLVGGRGANQNSWERQADRSVLWVTLFGSEHYRLA